MKNRKHMVLASLLVALGAPLFPAKADTNPPTPATQQVDQTAARVSKKVRHELVMLPYFTIFDNMGFQVQGDVVTLTGDVTRPVLKQEAQRVVEKVEGVRTVVNKIEVLPLSPFDNQIRWATARAVYGFPSLNRYALGTQPSIRIIVKNGHVALEGVVDSTGDKNVAGIRADSVPGVFSVENDLQVAPRPAT